MKINRVSKILSANDLGQTGSHQAGIAIPKDPAILQFFPYLNPTIYNPDCRIVVETPQIESFWELRYVYYNSKLLDQGTRNEYRLTGTTGMLRELAAVVGDSIAFHKSDAGEIAVFVEQNNIADSYLGKTNTLKNGWTMTIMSGDE